MSTTPKKIHITHNGTIFSIRQNAARTDQQAWVVGTADIPTREYDLVVDARHGLVCNCSEYEAFTTHHTQYLCEHGKALTAYLGKVRDR